MLALCLNAASRCMTKMDQKRGYGGAVFVSAGASFDAVGAVFRGNNASLGGGGAFVLHIL